MCYSSSTIQKGRFYLRNYGHMACATEYACNPQIFGVDSHCIVLHNAHLNSYDSFI